MVKTGGCFGIFALQRLGRRGFLGLWTFISPLLCSPFSIDAPDAQWKMGKIQNIFRFGQKKENSLLCPSCPSPGSSSTDVGL